MSGDAPKGYTKHALVAVFVIAALFGAVSVASAAGNASDSNANITNSSANALVQQPLQAPNYSSNGAPQQQVVVNLNYGKNVRTQSKTNVVSIGIVIIGVVGIMGGANYNRKTSRRGRKRR